MSVSTVDIDAEMIVTSEHNVDIVTGWDFDLPITRVTGWTLDIVHIDSDPNTTRTPCACCGVTPFTRCRLVPCPQSSNGYAPYSINLSFSTISNPDPPYTDHAVTDGWLLPWFGVSSTVESTAISNASGFTAFPTVYDCDWNVLITFQRDIWLNIRLFYNSGWKITIDRWFSLTFPYVPSGTEITRSLDSAFNPALTDQTIPINSAAYYMRMLDCGNSVVTTPCCTEKIPGRLIGIPSCVPVGTLIFDWQSGTSTTTNIWEVTPENIPIFGVGTIRLECQFDAVAMLWKWHLDIWTGANATGTHLYNAYAASSTCYPIYIQFTGVTIPGQCGGSPFTIQLTA